MTEGGCPRSGCPISLFLEIFGDRWSLLIVRDLLFKDRKTFQDFVGAEEGIATNILTSRLQTLEARDIIRRDRHPTDRRRIVYRLTARGLDLAPALVEMVLWSAEHEQTDAPPEVIAAMRADKAGFIAAARSRALQ
jgi:DNA-binding HxlR family transcriptional regulator